METCKEKHYDWMELRMRQQEEELFTPQLRRYLCKVCRADIDQLRAKGQAGDLKMHNCYCVGQLKETWLCMAHRNKASRDLEKLYSRVQTETETEELWDRTNRFPMIDDTIACPRCRKYPEDEDSNAWICKVCRTIAYLPWKVEVEVLVWWLHKRHENEARLGIGVVNK